MWMDRRNRREEKRPAAPGAKKRGFGIPHLDETIEDFKSNTEHSQTRDDYSNTTANLPSILLGLLERANRPSLAEHIHHLKP
jgi:hypothetical protein